MPKLAPLKRSTRTALADLHHWLGKLEEDLKDPYHNHSEIAHRLEQIQQSSQLLTERCAEYSNSLRLTEFLQKEGN